MKKNLKRPPQLNRPDEMPTNEDGLKRAVAVSVAFHVALLAAFTVRAVLFPSAMIPMESSIRVDIVALPDKSSAKLPKIEEPAAPKPEPAKPEPKKPEPPPAAPKVELPKPPAAEIKAPPKPPPKPDTPTVDLNKSRAEQASALKRLEAIDRLRRAAEQQQAAQEPAPRQSAPASKPVTGNEISKGTSLSGVSKLDHENYLESVHQKVSRNLNLPRWLTNANLVAKVQLFIDAQGNVVKKVLTRSSKQPVFDERLMNAIDAASPLPRPPSDLVNLIAVDGIEIEFAPGD